MKLRYHLDNKKDGLVILEAEPQLRNIFVNSSVRNIMRVPFPYILFIVRYIKLSSGFSYPGIYGSGLHVYGKLSSITDFSDQVLYLPTDYSHSKGLVCTDHTSDNKKFNSVPELVNFVVTSWWSHVHNIDYQPFSGIAWHEAKLDQINSGKWLEAFSLRESLLTRKNYGRVKDRVIPENAKMESVQWPTTLEIKPLVGKALPDSNYYDRDEPEPEPERKLCDCENCRRGRYRPGEL